MKLKLRVLVVVSLCVCIVLVVFLSWLTDDLAIGVHSPEDLLQRKGHAFGNEVVVAGRRGHLQVLRKDLDLSNYTDQSQLEENEVVDFLKKNILNHPLHRTREYLMRLMKVARDINGDSSKRSPSKKGGTNQEYLPEDLNDNLKGSDNLNSRGPNSQEFQPTVELFPQEMQYLKKVRPRKVHRGTIRHRSLRLYLEEPEGNITSSQVFQRSIDQFSLYHADDKVIDILLSDMAKQPIIDCINKAGGTQLKLTFYFQDGSRAIFKPMRFPRDRETLPDHFYFVDFERHNAEIAAFHLDRILGFNRVPPTAGRLINVTQDIKRFAQPDLLKTFFVSPAGNVCFHGQCDYYCDTSHAVCGHPEMMEGSFMTYLPTSRNVKRKTWRHPWRRSYHKRRKAEWETDNSYCVKVRSEAPYNTGRRLLDLMDMAVFDFLSGNLDRHHYETIILFGNYTFPLHLDNGRAFGKPRHDELSILAPIYQCCLFRYSTLLKLLQFNDGPVTLGGALRTSLDKDAISPILLEPYFTALDRRVKIILKTVYKCIKKNVSSHKVVIDDGF